MRDQLISFETAKLAKSKGFDEYCDGYITEHGEEHDYGAGYKNSYGYTTQPTQSLLQRWLREVYNIHFLMKIFYDVTTEKITYACDPIQVNGIETIRLLPQNTYELALEAGLQAALKLIK